MATRRPDWIALWGDLHYRGRRRALRAFLCELGLHWPIKFTQGYYSGGYEPPEPGWECQWCGHERLPYRAIFWEGWRWALIHPIQAWQAHREEALCR